MWPALPFPTSFSHDQANDPSLPETSVGWNPVPYLRVHDHQ